MQPAEVLSAVRSRWLVVVMVTVLGMAAAWFFTPSEGGRAQTPTRYEARHVLLYEPPPSAGRDGAAKVNVLAYLARVGDIPERVAAELAYEGGAPALTRAVEVVADQDLGVIEILAQDGDEARAAQLADTMAAQVIRHLDEQSVAERQERQAEDIARAEALRQEIADLDARITAGDPNRAALTTQRDALAGEYGSVVAQLATPADVATLRSIETATAVPVGDEATFQAPSSRTARVLIALVVSTILAVGMAVLLDRADDRIRSKPEAERAFRLPIIAGLHLLTRQQRRNGSLVAVNEDDPGLVETYRALRAAIMLFQVDPHDDAIRELLGEPSSAVAQVPSERRVILITSAQPSEGKSTTAANLAASFVQLGKRVLLINADAASSSVDELVGALPGPGTLDFLRDPEQFPIEAIAQDSEVPGLRIVPRGSHSASSSRAPDGERLLVKTARAAADIVIIDSGPLLLSSFAGELATLVDAVIVMCWSGKTPRTAAGRVSEMLELLHAPALGVVLVARDGRRTGYYYGKPTRLARLRSMVSPRSAVGDARNGHGGESDLVLERELLAMDASAAGPPQARAAGAGNGIDSPSERGHRARPEPFDHDEDHGEQEIR